MSAEITHREQNILQRITGARLLVLTQTELPLIAGSGARQAKHVIPRNHRLKNVQAVPQELPGFTTCICSG